MTVTSDQAQFEVIDDLSRVSCAEWDKLVTPTNFYLSYHWLLGQQASSYARAEYGLLWDGDRLLAASPMYYFARNDVFDSLPVARGSAPLWVGARTGYRSEMLIAPEAPRPAAYLRALYSGILQHARRAGRDSIFLAYLTRQALGHFSGTGMGGSSMLHDAEAVIPVVGSSQNEWQPSGKKARREIQAFRRSGLQISCHRLSAVLERIVPLIKQTSDKHGDDLAETDIRGYLREQARTVDGESVVFFCQTPDGIPVGCSVKYVWQGEMYGRVAGFNYQRLRGAFEYFNLVYYAPLAFAASHDIRRLHLGTTALDAKSRRGAEIRALWSVLVSEMGTGRPVLPYSADADRERRDALVGDIKKGRSLTASQAAALEDPLWSGLGSKRASIFLRLGERQE